MKTIRTQSELDSLVRTGVLQGEEVEIVGSGLRLGGSLQVYGVLKIGVQIETSWNGRYVEAWESSHVVAWESSHVEARGSSVSWIYSIGVSVELYGWSVAFSFGNGKYNITKKQKTANVINVPEMKPTFDAYEARFPVKKDGKKLLFYKAVHKKDSLFTSDHDRNFIYEVGKVYEHKNSTAESGSCAPGLHVAFKSWARNFGIGWSDLAILECEVEKKDIVVSQDSDGKVRCSRLKVIREVPESEWYKNI